MALKFALIVAFACIAQGFAQEVAVQENSAEPCKVASETALEIQANFEETMDQFDEIREYVTITSMEAYFKGTDPIVVLRCLGAQREKYIKLGQRISQLVRSAAKELAEDIGDQYDKVASRAIIALRTIAITVRTVPAKVLVLIQNREFEQAFKLIKEARMVIESNVRIVIEVVEELRVDIPQTADKAIKMAREIRAEAQRGSQEIVVAFRKCVEEGGPKNPADPESESESKGESESESESNDS